MLLSEEIYFPFLSLVQVFYGEISLVRRLKCPYSFFLPIFVCWLFLFLIWFGFFV